MTSYRDERPIAKDRRWPQALVPRWLRPTAATPAAPQTSLTSEPPPLPEAVRKHFDPAWYLETYLDVAAAGIDPLDHFTRYGLHEGRLPGGNRAIAWEHHLWRGAEAMMLPRLAALLEDGTPPWEQSHAAWALGRWHAWQGDWNRVNAVMRVFRTVEALSPVPVGPQLLQVEALQHCGQIEKAALLLEGFLAQTPDHPDLLLAQANLAAAQPVAADAAPRSVQQAQLACIRRIYANAGLAPVSFTGEPQTVLLDRLRATTPLSPSNADDRQPLISVVVPVFNAEATVTTALRALYQQTWPRLEILVVNDASTDQTRAILEAALQQLPPRPGLTIRLLQHEKNRGAYAARNTGLTAATGDFITTHDSDDWSHPQKLERQATALQDDPAILGTLSHWVRCTPNLHFHRWRIEEGWIYRNVSSLMFRRSVFETLGYWDCVDINADTEYYHRIQAAFGAEALREILPGVPLAFGRSHSASLSQHSQTHLITQFLGVRKDHQDAARRWHQAAAGSQDLHLAAVPEQRPFLAPVAILRGQTPVRCIHPMDLVQQSGLFDAGWYVSTYADLQDVPLDAFEHYWRNGSAEGRDPGPNFSTSGYRARYAQRPGYEEPPLLHYLTEGKAAGLEPLPTFEGAFAGLEGDPTFLVCAHQAEVQLHGAERSLLDVLSALHQLGVRAVVTLPSAINADYLAAVRERSAATVVLPYRYWHAQRPACEATQRHFEQLVQRFGAQAVYANTLVLDEPLLAARAQRIPALIHVRELPTHDVALCEALGATSEAIIRRAQEQATLIIANSKRVAADFAAVPTAIVLNTIDAGTYDIPLPAPARPEPVEGPSPEPTCSIALISSNLPKKGLDDFVQIATHLADHPNIRFLLFGPENQHTDHLRAAQDAGTAPPNLVIAGYVATPQQALAQADVVLNLSNFQESFGRTVLEAMAAARPVVCYAWGALPELVVDGETGYLVPFRDVAAVAERILRLAGDADLRQEMGQAGRKKAVDRYSPEVMASSLAAVLRELRTTE